MSGSVIPLPSGEDDGLVGKAGVGAGLHLVDGIPVPPRGPRVRAQVEGDDLFMPVRHGIHVALEVRRGEEGVDLVPEPRGSAFPPPGTASSAPDQLRALVVLREGQVQGDDLSGDDVGAEALAECLLDDRLDPVSPVRRCAGKGGQEVRCPSLPAPPGADPPGIGRRPWRRRERRAAGWQPRSVAARMPRAAATMPPAAAEQMPRSAAG